MAADQEQLLYDLLQDFDTAMLVTHSSDGSLHARPMAVAQVEANGNLWFVTDRGSGKIGDIHADAHVNVVMQGGGKFVSISGSAAAVDDCQKVDELWKETMKVWFPDGKDDPRLVLLRVDACEGEFWNNSGLNAIKYLFKAGRAYLRGERPQNDRTEHGRVKL